MKRLLLPRPVFPLMHDVAEHLKGGVGVAVAFVFQQEVDEEDFFRTEADFEEHVCAVVAEPAVGLIGADDAECAEIQLLQERRWQETGEQSARVVEVSDEPAKVGVMAVLGVVCIHALIKITGLADFQRNHGKADPKRRAGVNSNDCSDCAARCCSPTCHRLLTDATRQDAWPAVHCAGCGAWHRWPSGAWHLWSQIVFQSGFATKGFPRRPDGRGSESRV